MMWKKKANILVLVVLSLGLLAGCGNGNTKGSNNLRMYDSIRGEVEVPQNPERIVTDYYTGQLLSIDAPLVGADLTYRSPAWDGLLDGVENIGQSTEKVASLNPDLIISFSEENYKQYSKIAPTVLIPYGTYNEEEIVLELGKIVNREDAAAGVISEFNDEVEGLEKLVNPKQTYTILEVAGKDAYFYGNKYGRLGYVIYDKLELPGTKSATDTILKNDDSFILATEENLDNFVGDVLILSTPDAKTVNNSNLLNSKTFKNTKAYKENNVFYVDSNLFYHTDMISIEKQINILKGILDDEK